MCLCRRRRRRRGGGGAINFCNRCHTLTHSNVSDLFFVSLCSFLFFPQLPSFSFFPPFLFFLLFFFPLSFPFLPSLSSYLFFSSFIHPYFITSFHFLILLFSSHSFFTQSKEQMEALRRTNDIFHGQVQSLGVQVNRLLGKTNEKYFIDISNMI